MNGPIRLIFDENMGKPIVAALARLLAFHKPPPTIIHLIDFEGREGSDDRTWIPKLAQEGWTVVSADVGRGKRDARLPVICKANGVTHILFSGKMHNSNQFEKARAIILLWPRVLEAIEGPRGMGYSIRRGHAYPVIVEK